MSDWGFIVQSSLAAFLLTSIVWVRIMRTFFAWLGLGPR